MTTTQDAATIAASIDLASVAGHNLRALFLRLADEDPWIGDVRNQSAACDAWGLAERLGLTLHDSPSLTPLGREVAERLRPVPWRVCDASGPRQKRRVLSIWQGSRSVASCWDDADAGRIAALLTQDDLRAAKTYRTEPDQ
jgi:hypothetical protein